MDFEDFWGLHGLVFGDAAPFLAGFGGVEVGWPDYCFVEFSHVFFHLFVSVIRYEFHVVFVYAAETEAFKLYNVALL